MRGVARPRAQFPGSLVRSDAALFEKVVGAECYNRRHMSLFAAAFLAAVVAAVPQDPNPRAEAERLAQSGAHAQALARFQALAAADPDDLEARLWIARLHALMHHPQRALDVYQSIIATNSQHVEALVGAGTSLTTLERLDEAADALSRAEALAADEPSVLAAQGRMHHAAGRHTLALAYYERALLLQPGDIAMREGYDALRAERAHRLEGTYLFEHFDTDAPTSHPDARDTHAGLLEVNVRVSDAVRLFALGQYERFNRRDERRAGAGLEWNVHRRVWLRAGALGGNDTLSLPTVDVFAQAVVTARRTRYTFGTRYFDFDVADLWAADARVHFAATEDVELFAGYRRSRAELPSGVVTSDGAQLGVGARLSRRLTSRVEYRYGLERLDWLTLDRLGNEGANTVTLGAAWEASPFVTLGADYDYQSRPGGRIVHRGLGRFVFRF